MIPVRLQVRNFLCYREDVPALDFSGLHVACLSGANGHGKSALLDAMTWALWGKARARQDDQLVHLGQTEMEVEFQFMLDGHLYRIIRKRSLKGRGQGSLELQVEDGDGFRVLTEASMRATQARINQILRMDYDTFVNSAFLLQGRADEFTVKSPADRKQVLADILGLSLYDLAEDLAKQRAKECETSLLELTAQVREIDRELAHLPEYQSEEKKWLVAAERQAEKKEGKDLQVEALQRRLSEMAFSNRELTALREGLAQSERGIQSRANQIESLDQHIEKANGLLAQEESIETGYSDLLRTREEESQLARKASQALELDKARMGVRNAVEQAEQKLSLQLQQAEKELADRRQRAAQVEALSGQLEEVRQELADLDVKETEREDARLGLQHVFLQIERLDVENKRLRVEMEELREKMDELSRAEAHCPLCRSVLSDEKRAELLEEMNGEGQAKKQQYTANKEALEALEARKAEQRTSLARLDGEVRERPQVQRREAALAQALADAESALREIEKLESDVSSLRQRLEGQDFAADARARLADLQQQVTDLHYDAEAHSRIREKMEGLSRFESDRIQLDNAREQADMLGRERGRLESEIQDLQATGERDQLRKAELEEQLSDLPKVEKDYRELKAELDDLTAREREARDRLAAARQKIDFCDQQAIEKAQKGAALGEAAAEKALYEDLRVAFGKKGIQAMIIESVIPEIQDEANTLLARMTDGKMTVKMETQRDTKSGSTVETLDIHISDELGPRPYELYSGGEAFRVNFAIRIALSKLLARRAGAQLRTLVIDEGFGSQDADGRLKLVDAIQSIQDDFEKILIITHVEELRDVFPVRIHVEKTSEGSTFSIM